MVAGAEMIDMRDSGEDSKHTRKLFAESEPLSRLKKICKRKIEIEIEVFDLKVTALSQERRTFQLLL